MRSLKRINGIVCNLEFSWFPFDIQNCEHPIILDESTDDLKVHYDENQFLEDSEEFKNSLNPDWNVELFSQKCEMEDKQCFSVKFVLTRKTSNHILHTFVPSIMLSIASGTSLFIPDQHMPARMCLSVTTCLSMITLFVGAE